MLGLARSSAGRSAKAGSVHTSPLYQEYNIRGSSPAAPARFMSYNGTPTLFQIVS